MRRALVLLSTAATTAALALTGGAPPAGAAPAEPAEAIASAQAALSTEVQRTMAAGNLSADEALRRYWTPERMRAAIPMPIPVAPDTTTETTKTPPAQTTPAEPGLTPQQAPPPTDGTSGTGGKGGALQGRGQASGAAAQSGQGAQTGSGVRAARVPVSRTVGKVFFYHVTERTNYVCSAATINSANKRLLSTAGHCVHGGRGGDWHQNWVFVPAYGHGGVDVWAARNLITFQDWIQNSDLDRDVAFVNVHDRNGVRIVNAVGGNGIQYNAPRSRFLTILGYPAEPPYPGDKQYYCTGTTTPVGNRIRMACPLTKGSSGGPWLYAYTGSPGIGYINGVTSTTNATRTALQSPYFDTAVHNLYLLADSWGA